MDQYAKGSDCSELSFLLSILFILATLETLGKVDLGQLGLGFRLMRNPSILYLSLSYLSIYLSIYLYLSILKAKLKIRIVRPLQFHQVTKNCWKNIYLSIYFVNLKLMSPNNFIKKEVF